jgi:hypothetical protein
LGAAIVGLIFANLVSGGIIRSIRQLLDTRAVEAGQLDRSMGHPNEIALQFPSEYRSLIGALPLARFGPPFAAVAVITERSGLGLVSRASPVHAAMRNCTRDEGGPFGVGNQVLISSHRKLLRSKAVVVNVAETSGQDPGTQFKGERGGQTVDSAFRSRIRNAVDSLGCDRGDIDDGAPALLQHVG